MKTGTIPSIVLVLLLSLPAAGQNDWSRVDTKPVGDSLHVASGPVIVTGTVRNSSGDPVPGATLSMDVLKYFDYSDKQGRYTITCPTGEYRLIVRHVGMLPYLLHVKVYGSGV